jgi:hypothetical protein
MSFGIETAADNPHALDMVAYMLGQFPELVDSGVSGYPIISRATANVVGNYATYTSGIIGKLIFLNTQNFAEISNILEPIFTHINKTWPGFEFLVNITHFPSFYSWYEEKYDGSPVGYENVMSSRLLDGPSLMSNATATKLAFEKFSEGGFATVYIVSGKGVWNAKPRGGRNAALPAWRKSYVHSSQFFHRLMRIVYLIAATMAPASLNATAKAAAITTMSYFTASLREFQPEYRGLRQ